MEDVVLFLSNDGDSEPIYLWRERSVASAPLPAPADAGQTLAAKEEVDAEMKALFEKYDLGDVYTDVRSGLKVTRLAHLAHVEAQDVDEMAKYMSRGGVVASALLHPAKTKKPSTAKITKLADLKAKPIAPVKKVAPVVTEELVVTEITD
jgi:hypothetical protein